MSETTQEQVLDKTENVQQQEPEPSRDAKVRACCNCAGDHVTIGCGRFVPRCQSFPLDDATMQCELPMGHEPVDGVVMHRGGTIRQYDPATGRGPVAVSDWTWSDDGRYEGGGPYSADAAVALGDNHIAEPGAMIAAARAFVAAYEALDATEFFTTRQRHIDTFDEALARLRAVLGESKRPERAPVPAVDHSRFSLCSSPSPRPGARREERQ